MRAAYADPRQEDAYYEALMLDEMRVNADGDPPSEGHQQGNTEP